MSGFIDFAASKKCYAITWSYGEICVGCNCCGRQEGKLKIWEARLDYHKTELDRELNFNGWAEDYPEIIKAQKSNNKANISYHRAKIRYCNKAIKATTQIKTKR